MPRSALRQFYIALWRGHIAGWSLADFEEATGLKLTWEGNLKEELPPMPQFLNRLLALPIDEQNVLFAALETRIEANIEVAIEAGTFERGVETIAADSLTVASRETVFTHEGSGAETEIVEILRRDRLVPLTADAALSLHAAGSSGKPRLMVNAQSKRAALILPAPSRMFDDGGVQERVRLVRPAARETMRPGRPRRIPVAECRRGPLARVLGRRDRGAALPPGVPLLAGVRAAAPHLGPASRREHAGPPPRRR